MSAVPVRSGGVLAQRAEFVGMAQEPDTLGRFSVMSAARVIDNAVFAFVAPYTDHWVADACDGGETAEPKRRGLGGAAERQDAGHLAAAAWLHLA